MNEPHITITELRADFPNINDRLEDGDTFILTRHGFPFAAIVPIADYRKLTQEQQQ